MTHKFDYTEWVVGGTGSTSKYDYVNYIYPPQTAASQCEWQMSNAATASLIGNNNYWSALGGSLLGQGLGAMSYAQTAGNVYVQQVYCNGNLASNVYTYQDILKPETMEQIEARVKQEAERAEKRKAASPRAEKLLFSILTPTQVKQYTDDDFIDVLIHTRTYRIKKGYSRNVQLIEAGKPVALYCAHPADGHILPAPDAMLAQLLMLKSNETEFLKIANRTVLQ